MVHDPGRAEIIHRYAGLAAPADGTFDRIAAMAATIFGTPIATVSIVDEDRVWFAATRGLDGVTHVGTEPGLCASAVRSAGPYVVNDAEVDPRTMDHPLVRGALKLRFYAAAPIVIDGHRLGTVNVIDRKRRRASAEQLRLLSDLAATVAQMLQIKLEALTAVAVERASVAGERARSQMAARRAQYLAEAGHVIPEQARPEHCQLGGTAGCALAAELKVADSWGDSSWGCWEHAEDALRQVPSVFLAEASAHGLKDYVARRTSTS